MQGEGGVYPFFIDQSTRLVFSVTYSCGENDIIMCEPCPADIASIQALRNENRVPYFDFFTLHRLPSGVHDSEKRVQFPLFFSPLRPHDNCFTTEDTFYLKIITGEPRCVTCDELNCTEHDHESDIWWGLIRKQDFSVTRSLDLHFLELIEWVDRVILDTKRLSLINECVYSVPHHSRWRVIAAIYYLLFNIQESPDSYSLKYMVEYITQSCDWLLLAKF